ncbi:hypothetical protein BDP27DRAFT_1206802, partial [Rhodocollybia butyracea]
TYYLQNGQAGACGKVHADTDLIAAIDKDRYGDLGAVSPLCWQQVKITNTENGNTAIVTIADACPSCENNNSIDLSKGAFEKLATLDEGMVPSKPFLPFPLSFYLCMRFHNVIGDWDTRWKLCSRCDRPYAYHGGRGFFRFFPFKLVVPYSQLETSHLGVRERWQLR